jgi:hypothetical protein
MSSGHAPFAVLNRTGNPVVRAILRSPAHRLLSGRLALITLTGRRTGRQYTFPVGYRREGDLVKIVPGAPERKRWWRNLLEGGRVELRLAGENLSGWGQARGDEASGVTVEVRLDGRSPSAATTPASSGTPLPQRSSMNPCTA